MYEIYAGKKVLYYLSRTQRYGISYIYLSFLLSIRTTTTITGQNIATKKEQCYSDEVVALAFLGKYSTSSYYYKAQEKYDQRGYGVS